MKGESNIDVELGAISPILEVPIAGSVEYSNFKVKDEYIHGITINKGVGFGIPIQGMPASLALGQTKTDYITIVGRNHINIKDLKNDTRGCLE